MSINRQILIEGYTTEELQALPDQEVDAFVLSDAPIAFKIGSAEMLGHFKIDGDALVVELAHINGAKSKCGGRQVIGCKTLRRSSRMNQLTAHSNVYNTCLRLLRERGYELRLEGDLDAEGIIVPSSLYWIAIGDGYQMNGHNPIELLGLVAIYERRNPVPNQERYWWYVSGPDIYQELMDQAFPDVSSGAQK